MARLIFRIEPLFSASTVNDYLSSRRHQAVGEVINLPFYEWPSEPKAAFVAAVVDKYAARQPLIDRAGITVSIREYRGSAADLTDPHGNGNTIVPTIRYVFRIPIIGDLEFLKCRPSSYSIEKHATSLADGVLQLRLVEEIQTQETPATAGWSKRKLDEFLNYVEDMLKRSVRDIENFNGNLKGHIETAYGRRAAEKQAFDERMVTLPAPIAAPMPKLPSPVVKRVSRKKNIWKSVLVISLTAIIFGSVLFGVVLALIYKSKEDTSLVVLQCIAMSAEIPILGAALVLLIRNIQTRFDEAELEYGVVEGRAAANEVADQPFETRALADSSGEFTLLFRNQGTEALKNVKFRISARRADNGQAFGITGIDGKHVESETDSKSLKTTDNFRDFKSHIIMPLTLRSVGYSLMGEPVVVNVTIEVIWSEVRIVPGLFEVQVQFGDEND